MSHPPLALTDSQMTAVLRACAPLLPQDRDAFLRALAQVLRDEPELGDGVVFRAIRSLQREFWQPPMSVAQAPRARRVAKAIA